MAKIQIDFLETYNEDAIIQELKRIAHITGKNTVTKKDIESVGRLSYGVVNKRFGSLRRALQKADLIPQRFMKSEENELLGILVELWEQVLASEGRRPLRNDHKKYGYAVSSDTFVRRFGSWKKALLRAYESASEDKTNLETEIVHHKNQISRTVLSLRKRFFVLKRDDFTCQICGASGKGVRLEVDHIVPVSKGGTNDLANLQTLCFNCNRGKRDTS